MNYKIKQKMSVRGVTRAVEVKLVLVILEVSPASQRFI